MSEKNAHGGHGAEHGAHGGSKESGKGEWLKDILFIAPTMLRKIFKPQEFFNFLAKMTYMLGDFLGAPVSRSQKAAGHSHEAHAH